MLFAEVITNIDTIEPNQYSQTQKMAWLSSLDGQIFDELVLTHVHGPEAARNPCPCVTDELLVPEPYAHEIYENYLKAMIAAANHETAKYNTAMAMFNSTYSRYASFYNRRFAPLSRSNRFHF